MTTELAFITTPVELRNGDDRQTVHVLGSPTGVPGLAVTPHISRRQLTGRWVVTHIGSGLQVPTDHRHGRWWGDPTTFEIAQRIAAALGTLDIDWTADNATIMAGLADPDGLQAYLDTVRAATDSTATTSTSGRTVQQLRADIAAHAHMADQRFTEIVTRPGPALTNDEGRDSYLAHGCTTYGWAVVAILELLAGRDPNLAEEVADLIDTIGVTRGADHELCTGVPYPPGSGSFTPAGREGAPA